MNGIPKSRKAEKTTRRSRHPKDPIKPNLASRMQAEKATEAEGSTKYPTNYEKTLEKNASQWKPLACTLRRPIQSRATTATPLRKKFKKYDQNLQEPDIRRDEMLRFRQLTEMTMPRRNISRNAHCDMDSQEVLPEVL